ncbi:hypothetical protein ACN3XK_11320 [Actinomadura welshii]
MQLRSAWLKAAAVAAAAVLVAGLVLQFRADSSGREPPYRGPLASPGSPAAEPGGTRRIALNTEPADYPRLQALGYDLVDVRADASLVSGVPPGMQAFLWVGNFHCGEFELGFESFKRAVREFGRDPRVYGWYLSDEPDAGDCPEIAEEIRVRAEYIAEHAPGQVSYISLTDFPMKPLARVGVDLVGLDPYPCQGSATPEEHCDIGAIDQMVGMADDAGIPRARIAPVLQTFGQSCSTGDKQYWLPTEPQFREILASWDRLAPSPPLEISYSWGHQDEWACPTLADAAGGEHPDLQSIMKARNRG